MIRYPLISKLCYAAANYPIQRTLNQLEESQWWSTERLRQFRNEKLTSMIRHCYDHVPYYRRVMDERGLKPSDITTLDDLPKLPILTKDLVRKQWDSLQADNTPARWVQTVRTGGTTGEPMRITLNKYDGVWSNALYDRGLSWAGLLPTMPRAKLFGGSLGTKVSKRLRDRLSAMLNPKTLLLHAFELHAGNVADYVARIKQCGAQHLIGYSSAIYNLAILVEQAGLSLSFKAVMPTSELLLDSWREKIETVFGCKAMPYYGCGELNSLGYTCPDSTDYHRCDEHAVIEVEADDGDISFQGEGAFILTDLDSYAMPIIRYRNGDAGELSDAPCSCGRGLGRITRLSGRAFDMLIRPDGQQVSGVIGTVTFHFANGVTFWQFVQNEPGEVTLRLVVSSDYDPAVEERRIVEMLQSQLGQDMRLAIEYVENIERTPAGKAKFVINNYLASQG